MPPARPRPPRPLPESHWQQQHGAVSRERDHLRDELDKAKARADAFAGTGSPERLRADERARACRIVDHVLSRYDNAFARLVAGEIKRMIGA